MRALLEKVRRGLEEMRDELVHQQAMNNARNRKPSRRLAAQQRRIEVAIVDIDEALDEEGCREKARAHAAPIVFDLDASRRA